MQDSDVATLVRDVLAGDREAYSVLVRRYQDYAYGVAIGMLSDFDLARDVVQESFLCAFRSLRNLRDPARFGGWLHGIVRNMAFRAIREIERVRTMADELDRACEVLAPTPSPAEAAEDAERREIVRHALERLNDRNREAVSLYYVDGLSYDEIAEFLDVTPATVQGRLQRARAQLRKELTMVEKTFKDEELPEDFSAEIQRLLDAAATLGDAHTRALKRLSDIGAPAVEPLCEALADPRVAVQMAAARALCVIGDTRALRPLLRALYGENRWTAHAVLRTGRVLTIPGMRDELLRIVRQAKPQDDVYWTIQALAHATGDDEVYDCLCGLFRDPHSRQRIQALWALCRIKPESGTALVTEALRDPVLGRRGTVGWIALLNGLLPPIDACLNAFGAQADANARVAAGHLVLKHGQAGVEALEEVLRTGSAAGRTTAALALARPGHTQAFDVLKQELLDPPSDRKWFKIVSRVLGAHYGPELADWLEREGDRLADAHAPVWALARNRTQEVGPMVEMLLRQGTPSVQAAALRILARQQGADLLPELRRCLCEGQPRKVAQEAFRQMLRLGESAVPTVRQMLTSEHWTERKAAFCLLRRWGKLTAEQRVRGQQDPHVAVRQAAVWNPVYVEAARWHPKWARRIADA